MTNFLSSAEQKVVSDLKGVYATLTADAKAEIVKIVKAEVGLMTAHPVYYTLGAMGAGAVVVEAIRLFVGHP